MSPTGTRMGLHAHPAPRAVTLPLLALTAAIAALLSPGAVAQDAAAGCSRVAAPGGSDSASGTEARPYRTAQRLVASLNSGQTGCLRGGTYGGDDVRIDTPGVTLRSYPGETAVLGTFFEVLAGGDRAHVSGIVFDGDNHSNASAVKIQANDVVFSDNVVSKGGQGNCVLVGTYATVERLVLERNVIHNCGPAGSKFEHLVYLNHTRNAVVRWNTLTGNAGGWAVHLYDDADGTLVEHNLIDGNHGGVVFAGDSAERSDDNVVRDNIITFSGPRWSIEGSWGGAGQGTGNVAHGNCLYTTGPDAPSGLGPQEGFSAPSNLVLDSSPYENRDGGDLGFAPDSPCKVLAGAPRAPIATALPPPSGGGNARRRARRPGKRITLNAPRRVRPGQIIRLSGRLWRGRPRGRRVRIQVNFGRWSTFAHTTSRKRGRFSFRIQTRRQRRARTLRMRVAAKGYGHSRAVVVRIAP